MAKLWGRRCRDYVNSLKGSPAKKLKLIRLLPQCNVSQCSDVLTNHIRPLRTFPDGFPCIVKGRSCTVNLAVVTMKDNLSCDNFPELQTPVSFCHKPVCSVLTSEKPPYYIHHSNSTSWIVFHCFPLPEATRPPANATCFIVLTLISERTL